MRPPTSSMTLSRMTSENVFPGSLALRGPFGVVAVVADPVDLRHAADRLRVLAHEPDQHPLAVGDELGDGPARAARRSAEVRLGQRADEGDQIAELRLEGIDFRTVHAAILANGCGR